MGLMMSRINNPSSKTSKLLRPSKVTFLREAGHEAFIPAPSSVNVPDRCTRVRVHSGDSKTLEELAKRY